MNRIMSCSPELGRNVCKDSLRVNHALPSISKYSRLNTIEQREDLFSRNRNLPMSD